MFIYSYPYPFCINTLVLCSKRHLLDFIDISWLAITSKVITVVRDIFTRLKFRDFEENLTSKKICDFYFRGHMLHEAMPIYARGVYLLG